MGSKSAQLFSKARTSAASRAFPVSSAGQPPPCPLISGKTSSLDYNHLDSQRPGAASIGGSTAAALSNTQTPASAHGPIHSHYCFVFNNNQGSFDLGTINSVTTAAGPAQLPAPDGILPTPPVPPSKTTHLRHNDLRHRLEPRRLTATSALPRPTMSPPVDKPTSPAHPLPRLVPAIPPSDLRVIKTVAAARRLRSQRRLLRRQAAMPPPRPEAQPSPPPTLLHQESIAQLADIVLSSIHARFHGQGPVDRPALQPAPAAHAPASAAEGSSNPLDAAPAPPLPPPAAGHGVPNALCPPPSLRGNGASRTGPRQPPTPARNDDPPATPTPSSIWAFLEHSRDRSMDDRHARHRSRSRSPPRGSRHPALVRPRAPRGRPSGDRSPRSPRRHRSRSRRRSSASDDYRRGHPRRGERDAASTRRNPPVRRCLNGSPTSSRRRHASASPTRRSSRRSRSSRSGMVGRRSAETPTTADQTRGGPT
jgi:hypothetical protein